MTRYATKPDLHRRRLALLPSYEGRAPRYTSYPTAVQFTPQVDAEAYQAWLGELPPDQALSLYIHVPFCARLCWFCGCNTRVVRSHEAIADYVGLLVEEIERVAERLPARMKVRGLHFGGGTPNTLSPADLDTLFGVLRQRFQLEDEAEIAAELDPVQLDAEWVRAAAGHGLNRASLGVQDLSPQVQAAVNRAEPFAVVEHAVDMLRAAGVSAINIDLMYGLPKQAVDEVLDTLDQVLGLRPQRVALFGYAHVPWMKAHQKLIDADALPDAGERLAQSEAAAARMAAEGYLAIGLDHFALPDDPLAAGPVGRNFQGYTPDSAGTLLGFGASAIGALPQGFVQNHAAELAWRQAVEAGGLPTARGVAFTADDRLRAAIIEQLMCAFEVDLEAVCAAHGRSPAELADCVQALDAAAAHGVVAIRDARITVTELGRPFVRSVCKAFDAYVEPDARRHSIAV